MGICRYLLFGFTVKKIFKITRKNKISLNLLALYNDDDKWSLASLTSNIIVKKVKFLIIDYLIKLMLIDITIKHIYFKFK